MNNDKLTYTWNFVDEGLKEKYNKIRKLLNDERRKIGQMSPVALKKKGNVYSYKTPKALIKCKRITIARIDSLALILDKAKAEILERSITEEK